MSKMKRFFKKGILVSGALARVFIGVGATVLLFCSLKKKSQNNKAVKRYSKILFLLTIIIISVNHAFALSEHLRTEEVKENDIKGAFTLILYGARDINDIEALAILDLEGDQYTLEPYAPDFDYKVKKGLSEKAALNEAYKFVSYHNAFRRPQLSKIIDDKGNIIGYEVMPLYMPFVFGRSNVLEVDYWLKGDTIKITIKITPSIERALPERTIVSFLKP